MALPWHKAWKAGDQMPLVQVVTDLPTRMWSAGQLNAQVLPWLAPSVQAMLPLLVGWGNAGQPGYPEGKSSLVSGMLGTEHRTHLTV
jgi:hypothetical protein